MNNPFHDYNKYDPVARTFVFEFIPRKQHVAQAIFWKYWL
jgi:hypothetical protein